MKKSNNFYYCFLPAFLYVTCIQHLFIARYSAVLTGSRFYLMLLIRTLSVFILLAALPADSLYSQTAPSRDEIPSRAVNPPFSAKPGNIRSYKGKLYAYIVFLFMDNPHFINQIQEGTFSGSETITEEKKLSLYGSYLTSIKNSPHYHAAEKMRDVYSDFSRFSPKDIQEIEKDLEERGVLLKIGAPQQVSPADIDSKSRPLLEYCIFGERVPAVLKHPFFNYNERLFFIQPYIFYDEFSTSNSTFYNDMVYINHDEVENDFQIATSILRNKKTDRSLFFVGAPITNDIRESLKSAFKGITDVKKEIWRVFAIHEMTHKILNMRYKNFEQVRGEEMSLSSTIYENPRLGLAIMYSYFEYQTLNPHRIAAGNYLSFIASELGNSRYADDHSFIRSLPDDEIRRLTKKHFMKMQSSLK